MPDVPRRMLSPLLRWALTLLLILATAAFLDLSAVWQELARFSWPLLFAAMVVSVFQVLMSAWRWRYTARQLSLELPMPVAVREYYLASFLNQVLPGGVLGDVNRAWRHSLDSGARLASVHAVMIERLSGQLVMITVALAFGSWLAFQRTGAAGVVSDLGGLALAVIAAGMIGLVLFSRFWGRGRQYLYALRRDIRKALFGWPAIGVQVGSSAGVVASYLGVFALLAVGAGYWTGMDTGATLLALCSLLLLVMAIPLTVAGWGVREGAAAVLWPLAGLPPEQGVALSVGYGLAVLVSSLPGVAFVFTGRTPGH